MSANEKSPIGVVGVGWVGLVTAGCFAELGHPVIAMDVDEAKVEALRGGGTLPIHEPELPELVDRNRDRLEFTTDMGDVLSRAKLLFCCVDTPPTYSGDADLSRVEAVVAALPDGGEHALVMKSTVPAGTGTAIRRSKPDLVYVSCPEFLKEGTAVRDFLHPDRVVIGGDDPAAAARVAALYRDLDTHILITDAASAETIKYAANGFLAMKISFVNAVAALCEAVGADVHHVIEGIGSDQRIGRAFLRPGPGWGGSCFPKDSRALVSIAANHGYDFSMMRGVIAVNDEQRERMVRKIVTAAGRDAGQTGQPLAGVSLAVLGLTFKAGTDDMRESPSLAIIAELRDLGATIRAYDPTASGSLDAG